jgi:hypothetical protein
LPFFSVLVVVFVPSLCWIVVLLLDCPVAGLEVAVLLLDWPSDGFAVDVLLVFCPSGFSVVVVLELVWANPAVLRARPNPMATAHIFDAEFMVFLLVNGIV